MASSISDIMNVYPRDIMLPRNLNRHVRILVKEQESLAGGADELKKQVEKTANDVKEIIINEKTQTPTEINQRVSKLVNAKTIYGIALPLPNELSDSQSHSWDSTTGFVSDIAQAAKGIGGRIVEGATGGMVSGDTIAKGVANASSQAGFRQPLIDPGYFQDYKGTEPREFTLNWDLVPNNIDEAYNIFSIIYNLKKYTLPKSTVNGVSMLSPYLFEIQVGNELINALMNMNNVVCKSMTVNYSVDNSLQMFADGMPKYISLNMTFAERALVTSDFY